MSYLSILTIGPWNKPGLVSYGGVSMNGRLILRVVFLFLLILVQSVAIGNTSESNPRIVMETSKGNFLIELYPEKAPVTVKNFMSYVDAGFYDGTIFHRVIPGFMIQGGGFTSDMKRKTTEAPIRNEADNGMKNIRGTVAMARTQDPHSATAQFFINTVDNDFLNHRSKSGQAWGYTVFGKVIQGMDVVDSISALKTANSGMMRDVPVESVIIVKAKRKP